MRRGGSFSVNPERMELSDETKAISAWRRDLRARLIAARIALPAAAHDAASRAIADRLAPLLADLKCGPLGFYWPIRREFDPLPLVRDFVAAGGTAALPVVMGRNRPLEFRPWKPDMKMATDAYGIPHPAAGETVIPATLLIPMVGFDAEGYRLGYGGGYYDRTLGVMKPRPRCIGLSFEIGRVETIRPFPFDMRMDAIITEADTFRQSDEIFA
jgi:5-formyltetrahydrofolate cyclo-ligase